MLTTNPRGDALWYSYAMTLRRSALVLTLLIASAAPLHAGEFGVNLYGLSYHYDARTYVDDNDIVQQYNEINPGIGAQFIIESHKYYEWGAEGGYFNDSKDGLSGYVGAFAKLKSGFGLAAGLGIALLDSDTWGIPAAILPVVTYRYSFLAANATWTPPITDVDSGFFGFYLTIYP